MVELENPYEDYGSKHEEKTARISKKLIGKSMFFKNICFSQENSS
jgi:hypothetical protein